MSYLTAQNLEKINFESLPIKQTLNLLKTNPNIGLNKQQVKERQKRFGLNKLSKKFDFYLIDALIKQLTNPFFIILIIGAFFSIFIQNTLDAIIILIIIFINILIDLFQEYKAHKIITSLKTYEKHFITVIRDSTEKLVQFKELVPGDIIILEPGDFVPADCRIIQDIRLEVDESILTGESTPVKKKANIIVSSNTILPHKKNLLFSNTTVVGGEAKAVVIKTGDNTEIGQITQKIKQHKEPKTKLEIELNKIIRIISIITIFLTLPLVFVGIYRQYDINELIMITISLMISAIPEGLPLIITLSLAYAVKKMSKHKVLIKHLQAAEILGNIDVICTDKTGTITYNKLFVDKIFLPSGTLINRKQITDKKYEKQIIDILTAGALCNNATEKFGDPLEQELMKVAKLKNITLSYLNLNYQLIDEIPFNSKNKYMISKFIDKSKKYITIIKGAPEIVKQFFDKKTLPFEYTKKVKEFSKQGYKVLAIGQNTKDQENKKIKNKKGSFEFLGLFLFRDLPRKGVKESIQLMREAGIKVIMLTGDHKETAKYIAEKVGLNPKKIIDGKELKDLDIKTLRKKDIDVFSRVDPMDKIKIVKALQLNKHRVAMIGDGVNDAGALKIADIGIAVESSSDLTKEMADIILLKDNFNNIPKAIFEGRRVFYNIRKFIVILLASNFDEILETIFAFLLNLPMPFLAIHILWINLITDSVPTFSVTFDKIPFYKIKKSPTDPNKQLTSKHIKISLISAYFDAIMSIFLLLILTNLDYSVIKTRTILVFSGIIFEFLLIFLLRSSKHIFAKQNFENKILIGSIFISLVIQIIAIYISPINKILHFTALNIWDILLILTLEIASIFPIFLYKTKTNFDIE